MEHILAKVAKSKKALDALHSFCMIKFSRHAPGWILISLALLLMGIRRIATLMGYHLPGVELLKS